jgi:hypothetical protein
MILLLQIYTTSGVLAGSIDGQRVFGELVKNTAMPAKPEVCFLDFTGIDVATTSFLRDSVIAYRNHARSTWPWIYPVCANLAPRVKEELDSYLRDRGDAFVTCVLEDAERVSGVELIGLIEGKQRDALRGVLDLGESDAPGLREHAGEEVAATAWNNRLVALAEKGILIEVRSGRNKRYRPVLEGLQYGA